MKALILAAGQGLRLKKYTQNLPKGMLIFQGKTLIAHQMALFKKCGINDILIVRGYAADKINYPGVRYYMNEEYSTTNMVTSFLTAKEEFNDDIIVSYADIIYNETMLRTMVNATDDFAVAVDDGWKTYWIKRYGQIDIDTESLVINECDHIVSIGLENPPADRINARYIGLLKFSKVALAQILYIWNRDLNEYRHKPWQQSRRSIRQAYMTDLINALIESGSMIKAMHFQHGWIEFDTDSDYEKAQEWASNGSIDQLMDSL